ncbi:MAG TPA: peptidoglycan-associated lipoprotein Pal [Terriglobia bacterium]|nr:peptidoglycan-associated lipoprotein Pal [Terriglobia bacterium]
MRQRERSLALLVGVLGVVLLAAACHKKAVAPPPPPPPPAAAPEKPTVNLTAVPSTIEQGQSVTLSWTSENATSLDLQPGVGAVQSSGSTSVSPTESTTYTLTATGTGGTATSTARVTVTSQPPPPPPQEQPAVSEASLFEQNIKDAYFDYNKSDIRSDAQQALTADADFLKSHPSISFTIEGHCDERGSEEYNLGLGDRRANAAKSFLVNLGIPASRITTISYGKDRPFCTESNEACWQQNRRAHLVMGGGQSQ